MLNHLNLDVISCASFAVALTRAIEVWTSRHARVQRADIEALVLELQTLLAAYSPGGGDGGGTARIEPGVHLIPDDLSS